MPAVCTTTLSRLCRQAARQVGRSSLMRAGRSSSRPSSSGWRSMQIMTVPLPGVLAVSTAVTMLRRRRSRQIWTMTATAACARSAAVHASLASAPSTHPISARSVTRLCRACRLPLRNTARTAPASRTFDRLICHHCARRSRRGQRTAGMDSAGRVITGRRGRGYLSCSSCLRGSFCLIPAAVASSLVSAPCAASPRKTLRLLARVIVSDAASSCLIV